MVVSQRCQYALRLALLLTRGPQGYVPVHGLAEALGTPGAFLSKVAQDLAHADLLATRRGPGGGVALARAPSAISLLDIVLAIDGPDAFRTCVLGLPGCGTEAPCPLHDEWTAARERLRDVFADTTLEDAASEPDGHLARLSAG
ncbi:RrF2 family transcriptional regulator [Rubrivirga sp. IMCC43871]|uniref:RrF2 family transcriptional regulator n=1 Tax=Rubrivirga sp. IMCC43871 TaxID=3391575 RepID=UPI00398F95B8